MQAHFFISTLMSGLLQIPRTTLNDRFRNKHSSRQEYYSKRRLLNDSEEAILTDWMDTLAMQGLPFNANLLRSHFMTLQEKYLESTGISAFSGNTMNFFPLEQMALILHKARTSINQQLQITSRS